MCRSTTCFKEHRALSRKEHRGGRLTKAILCVCVWFPGGVTVFNTGVIFRGTGSPAKEPISPAIHTHKHNRYVAGVCDITLPSTTSRGSQYIDTEPGTRITGLFRVLPERHGHNLLIRHLFAFGVPKGRFHHRNKFRVTVGVAKV